MQSSLGKLSRSTKQLAKLVGVAEADPDRYADNDAIPAHQKQARKAYKRFRLGLATEDDIEILRACIKQTEQEMQG
eukprot:COSAG01_NODE_63278_length_280_cov_1.674033_1_plen_75_part_01